MVTQQKVIHVNHVSAVFVLSNLSKSKCSFPMSRVFQLDNANTFVFPQELLVGRMLHWE